MKYGRLKGCSSRGESVGWCRMRSWTVVERHCATPSTSDRLDLSGQEDKCDVRAHPCCGVHVSSSRQPSDHTLLGYEGSVRGRENT
jgi:hypothetical protein